MRPKASILIAEDEAQELRLESICLAGGEAKILE